MTCPVCGYTATRVSNSYWCPNDHIYLGNRIATESLPTQTESLPTQIEGSVYEEIFPYKRPSKIFNYLVWGVMIVLYIIVIGLVAWSFLSGNLDDSSIFS